MSRRLPRVALLALSLCTLPTIALAQYSGGRFGGSRSGSSSGSSSFPSRSYSYSPRSSGSRTVPATRTVPVAPHRILPMEYQFPSAVPGVLVFPTDSAPHPTPGELTLATQRTRLEHKVRGPDGFMCPGIVSLGLFLGIFMMARRRRADALRPLIRPMTAPPGTAFGAPSYERGRYPNLQPQVYGTGGCEVRRVSVGFDWRARAQLQNALSRIAGAHDMRTEAGMYAGARAAQQALLTALPAARYAAFQRFDLPQHALEPRFQSMAADLNGRYQTRLVSDEKRAGPMAIEARVEEGQGLVVVTLIVGVTCALAPLPEGLTRDSVGHALATLLPPYPASLLSLEVVWSPAQDSDRMSSAELEKVYPELLRLDMDSPLGRVACAYCRVVYAAELMQCPACGAGETVHPRPAPALAEQHRAATSATVSCRYCKTAVPMFETQCQNCGARMEQ